MKGWVWFIIWMVGAAMVMTEPLVGTGLLFMWLAKVASDTEKEMNK